MLFPVNKIKKNQKNCRNGIEILTIVVTMAVILIPIAQLEMANDTIPPTYNTLNFNYISLIYLSANIGNSENSVLSSINI